MIYDVPTRYEQALDPATLSNIRLTVHAIGKAIEDCRNAGVNPDTDPAVVLLARHMGRVSTNVAADERLRYACQRRRDELRHFPPLLALALRGVEFDTAAKARFHEDGQEAMHRLAVVMGLRPDAYDVRSWERDISVSGDVLLQAADFAVALSIGGVRENREVLYRRTHAGQGEGRNHYAPISLLVRPERFADRLRRDLDLPQPATPATLDRMSA